MPEPLTESTAQRQERINAWDADLALREEEVTVRGVKVAKAASRYRHQEVVTDHAQVRLEREQATLAEAYEALMTATRSYENARDSVDRLREEGFR